MALQWFHFSGNSSVVFAKSTMITTLATTAVWLVATLITQPESDTLLVKFYRRAQPTRLVSQRLAAAAPGQGPAVAFCGDPTALVFACCFRFLCPLFICRA